MRAGVRARRPRAEDEEAIVVTARRREESLQDVPIAVIGRQRRSSSSSTARRTSRRCKADHAEPHAAGRARLQLDANVFIRGVGQQDPLWGFEPGVGLYVDDVYIARPQAAVLDIFDIERIEVLRGPQGTLYGRNTIGGAIKYVTRRLDGDAPHARSARSLTARYNQRDVVVSGSAPLGDEFVIGGAVASLARDGFGENLTTGAEHYNKDVFAYPRSARNGRRRTICSSASPPTASTTTRTAPRHASPRSARTGALRRTTPCCRTSTTRAPASATTTAW